MIYAAEGYLPRLQHALVIYIFHKNKDFLFRQWLSYTNQSGTKPNLVANFGLFSVICFQKYVQCGSNNNVTKYCGWGIPHNWDMIFGKSGGLSNLVAFLEN